MTTTAASGEPRLDGALRDVATPLAQLRRTLEDQREHLEQVTARRPDVEEALLALTERTNRALHRVERIERRLVRAEAEDA